MASSFLYRGASVSYHLRGKGRSIVFIHGFLGAKEIWSDFQKRLSLNYKVVILDLPGHGNSECIGYVHNMELLAECVKELLKTINVRKAIIIGHSLGGYVGLAFAELFPDAVINLILINSTSKGDSVERKLSRNQLIELVKKNKTKTLELLIPTFFGIDNNKRKKLINRYKKYALRASKRGIIATTEGMKIRNEREIVLKFAPFPYLIIAGEEDQICNSTHLLQETKLNPKGHYQLIENSSHMSILEQPEAVYRCIKLFIKK